jgi:hypothetical protein
MPLAEPYWLNPTGVSKSTPLPDCGPVFILSKPPQPALRLPKEYQFHNLKYPGFWEKLLALFRCCGNFYPDNSHFSGVAFFSIFFYGQNQLVFQNFFGLSCNGFNVDFSKYNIADQPRCILYRLH